MTGGERCENRGRQRATYVHDDVITQDDLDLATLHDHQTAYSAFRGRRRLPPVLCILGVHRSQLRIGRLEIGFLVHGREVDRALREEVGEEVRELEDV